MSTGPTQHLDGVAPPESAPIERGTALLKVLDGFSDEFIALLEDDRRQQPPMQESDLLSNG